MSAATELATADLDELRKHDTQWLRDRLTFVEREPGFLVEPVRSHYIAHMDALHAVIGEREATEA